MASNISKGDRVKITRGRKGLGVTGEVFWLGPDKFDPDRTKTGVHGDDGEKYWVFADYLQATTQGQTPTGPVRVATGDRVTWREGHETGEGTAFWVGPSKHGPGIRVGVDTGSGKRFLALSDVTTVEPYRLYGDVAATWNSGEKLLERSLDIRFVRPLKPTEIDEIARIVLADLRDGEDVLRASNGQYIWLPLSAPTNAEALAAAQSWLDDVDVVVPIKDAVFLAASPGQFGMEVIEKRPQWVGFLRAGGSYKANAVCDIFKDARARFVP